MKTFSAYFFTGRKLRPPGIEIEATYSECFSLSPLTVGLTALSLNRATVLFFVVVAYVSCVDCVCCVFARVLFFCRLLHLRQKVHPGQCVACVARVALDGKWTLDISILNILRQCVYKSCYIFFVWLALYFDLFLLVFVTFNSD